MNSEAVSAVIAKNPSLKAFKPKLEAMKSGAYVIHRSWGFGQIKSFDDATMRLVIDFKGKKRRPFCLWHFPASRRWRRATKPRRESLRRLRIARGGWRIRRWQAHA